MTMFSKEGREKEEGVHERRETYTHCARDAVLPFAFFA